MTPDKVSQTVDRPPRWSTLCARRLRRRDWWCGCALAAAACAPSCVAARPGQAAHLRSSSAGAAVHGASSWQASLEDVTNITCGLERLRAGRGRLRNILRRGASRTNRASPQLSRRRARDSRVASPIRLGQSAPISWVFTGCATAASSRQAPQESKRLQQSTMRAPDLVNPPIKETQLAGTMCNPTMCNHTTVDSRLTRVYPAMIHRGIQRWEGDWLLAAPPIAALPIGARSTTRPHIACPSSTFPRTMALP